MTASSVCGPGLSGTLTSVIHGPSEHFNIVGLCCARVPCVGKIMYRQNMDCFVREDRCLFRALHCAVVYVPNDVKIRSLEKWKLTLEVKSVFTGGGGNKINERVACGD